MKVVVKRYQSIMLHASKPCSSFDGHLVIAFTVLGSCNGEACRCIIIN